MSFLEKIGLKKKQSEAKGQVVQKEPKKEEIKIVKKDSGKKRPAAGSSEAYRVLIRPILSEKATHLATSGKYVFAVYPRANKQEIKKSIQQVYEVNVESVKIIKLSGKMRRYGRAVGKTSAWKKAVVTVRKGEKIPGIIEAVG
jgi:large subunit ribosomal protein L23